MRESPEIVRNYAQQAVQYVRAALGATLEYDSDTLPILDHYLTTARGQDIALPLITFTAGAYFGEVVRLHLGGDWELPNPDDPTTWRVTLPGGLSFVPAGMVLSALENSDETDVDSNLHAPPTIQSVLESALERMGQVSQDDYFSLCGRYDTLEHLQAVLLAAAAHKAHPDLA
jgi:hypothetical protein